MMLLPRVILMSCWRSVRSAGTCSPSMTRMVVARVTTEPRWLRHVQAPDMGGKSACSTKLGVPHRLALFWFTIECLNARIVEVGDVCSLSLSVQKEALDTLVKH